MTAAPPRAPPLAEPNTRFCRPPLSGGRPTDAVRPDRLWTRRAHQESIAMPLSQQTAPTQHAKRPARHAGCGGRGRCAPSAAGAGERFRAAERGAHSQTVMPMHRRQCGQRRRGANHLQGQRPRNTPRSTPERSLPRFLPLRVQTSDDRHTAPPITFAFPTEGPLVGRPSVRQVCRDTTSGAPRSANHMPTTTTLTGS